MTYYHKEISRIKNICYSNTGQVETVIGTRQFISNNFNKGIKLDQLAEVRFTSKFHLLRLFKKYYGQTPRQFLIDKRLEHSKLLISQGTSISGTCYDIGFDSPSSFSTLFKSRFGITPREFQKRATFTKSGQL